MGFSFWTFTRAQRATRQFADADLLSRSQRRIWLLPHCSNRQAIPRQIAAVSVDKSVIKSHGKSKTRPLPTRVGAWAGSSPPAPVNALLDARGCPDQCPRRLAAHQMGQDRQNSK